MASSITEKKSCSRCVLTNWIVPCEGCHALFCLKHASEHQQELSRQLINIQEESNLLEHMHTQHEECQEHPLFSQIDVWQHDTIAKIIQAADTAREELRQLLVESNNQKKIVFMKFNEQLQTARQTEHYTEIKLEQWKEELMNIKKQLETPCDIELISDKNIPPIHFIKIHTTKQTPFVSPSVSICDDSNKIECSWDDELEKPQSSTFETTTECLSTLEQDESSEIRNDGSSGTESDLCGISSILLDPNQENHLVLLYVSSTNQSQLLPILNQLTDHSLDIFDKEDECLAELQSREQVTIFIDLFDTSLDGQNCFLDTISDLQNVYSIYIRGSPSEDDNERAEFFRQYSKIKAIFENEQRLMVQWAIDTAAEFKKTGDMYVKIGDKDKGRQCFEQGITLYKRLSIFLNEKRRVR